MLSAFDYMHMLICSIEVIFFVEGDLFMKRLVHDILTVWYCVSLILSVFVFSCTLKSFIIESLTRPFWLVLSRRSWANIARLRKVIKERKKERKKGRKKERKEKDRIREEERKKERRWRRIHVQVFYALRLNV